MNNKLAIEREAFAAKIKPVLENISVSDKKYNYALASIMTAFDTIKALQQSSEPEPCMCCGKGHLYCDECGTAIYNPSHKSIQPVQSSEPVAEPYLYLRLKNGEPDWADDCVSTDYQCLTEDSSMDDGVYSALPLFTHPPASVPLEKYNKLLDALKRIGKYPTSREDEKDHRACRQIAAKAIEEAEGKEG